MKKYLFIDRDGTLVKEPSDFQVDATDKVVFEKEVIPALLKLQELGYTLVMVSNQDGLGTPSFPLETFTPAHELIVNTLESQGIRFEQILICPHKPEDNCECRKPKLGLVHSYLLDQSWDREHSYFIGDRQTDVTMGERMGITPILYQTDKNGWMSIVRQIAGKQRCATVRRTTRETDIEVSVNLDESGHNHFETGLGFFEHMLDQIATHGGISLQVTAHGDLQVDEHHTIEDVGIALGEALLKALGDKRGIGRFGFCLPMDEVYAEVFADKLDDDGVTVALDISGRPHVEFDFKAAFSADKVGTLAVQMVPHFFESLAVAMGLTLHMRVSAGNCHHQVEALFKAFGRALRQALTCQGHELPSSKGTL
ncbi:MAG: bifunctional histidinol-phosphatase/imidazoleglycerol-phosphate dehydratase HisB [Succinivibrio sp.]|nr:bifunctional histidinol-phosphatase/imidazoleglycerol-phosphate dehydratase HisB [Succinivibrio sp.]